MSMRAKNASLFLYRLAFYPTCRLGAENERRAEFTPATRIHAPFKALFLGVLNAGNL